MHSYLQINRLSCVRDDRELFEDLNFELSEGEVIQILGANGSGKTSLLRILCGLHLPMAGDVLCQGQSIFREREAYLRQLAYVGHQSGVKLQLTAEENLIFEQGMSVQKQPIDSARALQQVGLYGFEDVPCRQLSAGQRRRVAIARLLVSQCRIWILDEPLTAIDRSGVVMIESMLSNHLAEGGLAVITSHQELTIQNRKIRNVELN